MYSLSQIYRTNPLKVESEGHIILSRIKTPQQNPRIPLGVKISEITRMNFNIPVMYLYT